MAPETGDALPLLFLDGEAIVIDKPAGLAVHPGPRTAFSLEDRLEELRFGFRRSPVPVHRLDRDTSGCLLLARNPRVHRRLAAAFEDRRVVKTYLALVEGRPDSSSGRIELALAKRSSREAGWRIVPDEKGKAAVTDWELLAFRDGLSLLRLLPRTGRTHQLRVHLASGLALPILGDPVYGTGGEGAPLMLHASMLDIPREGKPAIQAKAPLPEHFRRHGFDEEEGHVSHR